MVAEDSDWYVEGDGRMYQEVAWEDGSDNLTIDVEEWTLQSVRSVLHLLAEADERAGRPLVRTTSHDGLRAALEWIL